jgi:branched-chain amino acid transport system permease protein
MLSDTLINGITAGSVYALVAVGMTIIFGVLRAINFAHGEYYMLGTFAAWWGIETFELPYSVSIPVAVLVVSVIALGIGLVVMRRLIDAPFQIGVIATLGVSLVLQNTVILIFGGTYKMFEGGWIEPVEIGDSYVSQQRIIIVVAALVIFAGLELAVRRTRFGKTMRAVSQNLEACAIVGVDVPRVVIGTFVLGCALAAFSGVLTAPVVVSLYGSMGTSITVKTFAIIVMGGVGNVSGTLFAAWILGMVESFVAGYLGLQYRDGVAFSALILVLTFMPHGLFSRRERF